MSLPTSLPVLRYNSILDADSYKIPHWRFYKEGTKTVYSYLESRGGLNDQIMFAGLQPLLYGKIAQPVQDWEIEEAQAFSEAHLGFPAYFNRAGWDRIVNKHDRKLPLLIKAVPEGLILPKRTPLLTVENTDPELAWLTSYKETMLLRDLWPACSIASRIFRMKRDINDYFIDDSDNPISPFALLDFMSRGVFGYNHSEIGGAVFTFMFQGSDNMPGIRYANHYYFHEMSAYSVAATEHSIASAFGRDNDDEYIDYAIERCAPDGILSLVGDTWNIFEFTKKVVKCKDVIANKNLTLVVRPDSGERKIVLPDILKTLASAFGTTKNGKGFDVINLGAKALWADGMNEHTVTEPFEVAHQMRIAPDSVMTGAGGGIGAADLDRDTDRWAFKASENVMADGTRVPIFKDPVTDPGKASKSGRFAVMRPSGEPGWPRPYRTEQRINDEDVMGDLLRTRFVNGEVVNATTLDEVRDRIDRQL